MAVWRKLEGLMTSVVVAGKLWWSPRWWGCQMTHLLLAWKKWMRRQSWRFRMKLAQSQLLAWLWQALFRLWVGQ